MSRDTLTWCLLWILFRIVARKLSFMILRNEFSTYFHACLSVRVVQIHVLLEIELSKLQRENYWWQVCPLCRYCTSGLPSDITVVVGEQSFHLHKVKFHQNESRSCFFVSQHFFSIHGTGVLIPLNLGGYFSFLYYQKVACWRGVSERKLIRGKIVGLLIYLISLVEQRLLN